MPVTFGFTSSGRWITVVIVAMVVGLGSVACGDAGAPSTASDVGATQRPPSEGPVGGPGTVENLDNISGLLSGAPILDADFADPFMLDLGDVAYGYASNTTSANVPVTRFEGYRFDGYGQATYLGDAMPTIPSWSSKDFIWAPAVYARPDGQYVMYYAGLYNPSGRQCVSRALSSSPAGPFVDNSTEPFVCPLDLGGAIDPSVVVDNGKPYLIYKNDGNCCKITTSLWSVPLSADGLSLNGQPTKLVSNDQPWEGGNIEAPSMVAVGNKYLLFYSANDWSTSNYAIGYAVCDTITGPCTKPDDEAWMSSTTDAQGPGGQEFFPAGDQVWMVYHGWLPGEVNTPDGERRLYLDDISVENNVPERIGAERIRIFLLWIGIGVLAALVVVVVVVVLLVRRRRRRRMAQKVAVPTS